MQRKLIMICILTISAVALMIANFATPSRADQVVSARDYQLVTARVTGGGEGLYILDNRTGILAVLTYDMNTRALTPRAIQPISDVVK
jgi:hypothetical protein